MGNDVCDLRQLFFRKATPSFARRGPLRETIQQGSNVLEAKAQFTGSVDDVKPINHAGIITAPATNSWRRRHQPNVLVITNGQTWMPTWRANAPILRVPIQRAS